MWETGCMRKVTLGDFPKTSSPPEQSLLHSVGGIRVSSQGDRILMAGAVAEVSGLELAGNCGGHLSGDSPGGFAL